MLEMRAETLRWAVPPVKVTGRPRQHRIGRVSETEADRPCPSKPAERPPHPEAQSMCVLLRGIHMRSTQKGASSASEHCDVSDVAQLRQLPTAIGSVGGRDIRQALAPAVHADQIHRAFLWPCPDGYHRSCCLGLVK